MFSKFQSNKCFLDSIIHRDENYCSPFSIYDNKMIVSGGTLNSIYINKLKYIVQLNLNFKLIKEGNITFYYQKDAIIQNNERSGIFKLFINYVEINSDNGLTDIK